jgi:hypothetical protein
MVRPVVRRAVVAAALLLGSSTAFAESRMALVIGQSAYRAVAPLPNPANDAKAMAQMLGDAGFEVQSAADLTQNELRAKVSDFAASVAAKGPDTVALVFYAGHGLQIDGENYLVPIDVDPKREADIPLQAVRLNDILNTLTAVPSKTRILLLDACRNNPFPGINKTAGRGLAHVDVKFGTPGTLLSFSTSPGAEAEDGKGANSPYTTALLKAGREPGLPIEDAFKRVRLAVNLATEGRQTPWESSSLVSDFRFFGPGEAATKPAVAKRTVDDWKRELQGKPAEAANELIVSDGSVEAYEAFVALYAQPPLGPQARDWLDRHYKMVAWNNAVIGNTATSYRDFLGKYPDSDLTATAQKLEERTRNKPVPAASAGISPTNVALAAPTCPCTTPPAAPRKAEAPAKKRADPDVKRAERPPARRMREIDDEVVVIRRAPPVYYEPAPRGYGYGGGGGYGGNAGRGRY